MKRDRTRLGQLVIQFRAVEVLGGGFEGRRYPVVVTLRLIVHPEALTVPS